MIIKIKQMLDDMDYQLKEAKRDRNEYKASFRNVSAENKRLKLRISELETQVK
jgi:phage shock protein A